MDSKIFRPVNKPRKTKDGIVRFRCSLKEKAEWVRQSRREGKTLSEWIIDQLNKF
jgi:hypothetical protein